MTLSIAILVIPYGFLANKYGHREVLFLAFVGLSLSETWGFLICKLYTSWPTKLPNCYPGDNLTICTGWFPNLFPIRLLWTQWLCELIGGGVSVMTSMVYLIVANVTSEDSRYAKIVIFVGWAILNCYHCRTNVYYRLHAVQMLSSVIALALSSSLMNLNVWLPWTLSELLVVASAFLTLLLPNIATGGLVTGEPIPAGVAQIGEDDSNASKHGGLSLKWRIVATIQGMNNTGTFIAANSQVILLLSMSAIGVIGTESLPLMLLQYLRKQYSWTFAKVNQYTSVKFQSLVR